MRTRRREYRRFVFGVNTTLVAHLRSMPHSVRQICLPWLIFGSSGLEEQPPCVATANVRRMSHSERVGKCVQRTAHTASGEIHRRVIACSHPFTNARELPPPRPVLIPDTY